MTDLLDNVAESYPVTLDDMVQEVPSPQARMPEAAVRNQSALTALLSDDPVNAYTQMQVEAQEGVSYTKDKLYNQASQKYDASLRSNLMTVLADPAIPFEQKKAAIDNLRNTNKQTATLVATEAAVAPVTGESKEAEDVRILGDQQYAASKAERDHKQKMMNQSFAKLNPSWNKLSIDVAEQMLAPFGVNKAGYGVINDIMQLVGIEQSRKRTAVTPGSAIMAIREKLATIPPQDVMMVNEKINDLIMTTPNIMFTDDNHFARMTLSNAILQEGGYTNVDMVLDNIVGMLDIIGIGSAAKSVATKLFKRSPAASKSNMDMRGVTDSTSPVSPVKELTDTNPERASALIATALKAEGDDVAKAVSGTDKQGLVVDMHMPQPASVDGSVVAKLPDPERVMSVLSLSWIAMAVTGLVRERSKLLKRMFFLIYKM
jgi:hypothetical protein